MRGIKGFAAILVGTALGGAPALAGEPVAEGIFRHFEEAPPCCTGWMCV